MTDVVDMAAAPATGQSGFRAAKGLGYLRFLKNLHAQKLFDVYLEIGTEMGRSLALSRSRSVAVDPFFRLNDTAMGVKPGLHLFQCGSDEFFATEFLSRNDLAIGFGFLDGMHLFEYLLRDLMNSERNARPGSVLALHDCCPFGPDMLTRDLEMIPAGAWTGDVWKLIPILQKYRPDLTLTVLDCSPTGLVLISALDPASTVLADHYDEIVADWTDVTLQDYGVANFFDLFDYVSAWDEVTNGFPLFAAAAMKDGTALNPVKVTT